MAITVTGKLNKPANEFQAGESKGFGIRIGEQYYDRETKQKEWTNYECVVFAKASVQIDFYRDALVAGAIVQLTGKTAKIKSFDGSSGQSLSIEILDASIGYIGGVSPSSGDNYQTSGGSVTANEMRPVGSNEPNKPDTPQSNPVVDDGFDDDIPFNRIPL